ncbi:hypothetical protein PC115_g10463 [Phytophthora cactorum]|uniref:PiggyBac transposable element-derived protein domain-containing protein n=1 Tax=Phytophthora cactorum TaxID=29920 RepID=A0A8T1C720_9STRA|nr:hypothetical protein PC115_g10463 [Phytophthora cactorum]KAG3143126.1 hypothetical protein C6341_g19168 [Phytophthora cactorum]
MAKRGLTTSLNKQLSSQANDVSGHVDQAADIEPNEKGDRDEEAARASGAAGIVGHGGEAEVDVGAGYDDAAGHVAVAGRGAQGGSGGRTTRRVASTNSAEGVCEVGVGVSIGGATGQAVVAGRGSHGGGAGGRCGGRTARRVARALSPTRVGVDGAAGQVAVGEADSGTVGQEGVAGRGARDYGARGGRKAPRVASTPSAEGDEVDSSEVGFDMDVGMDVYGAAGQAVGSSRAVRGLVAAAPDSPRPGSAAPTGETGAAHDVYVSKLVAFSPDKERWMKPKIYRPIRTAYIVGRVYQLAKKGKNASPFQIRWLESQFQSAVEHISVGVAQLGTKNYVALTRVKNPNWRILVRPYPTDEVDFEEDDSDCKEEVLHAFGPSELLPTSLAEVEAIKCMRFDPNGEVEGPSYLYQHSDGSTQTYLRPEFKHLFEHSTSLSFFAYIPLYFWRQVLHETNKYAVVNNIRMATMFTLDELMICLGILFFMAMNDKGEYANYWGLQAEDLFFGGVITSLDGIMTLHRFKLLRRCLSFNATPNTLDQDAAASIRPLLSLLKITGGQYIHVGRDVALDEASVACRTRQGHHMLVYSPMKPTGKYHIRLYMVCCSTTWIALNYKLHCDRSDILDRLSGVVDQYEAQNLSEELEGVSKNRQHVLEVTRPLFGTNRIVNMDNYYTSVQLLQELRLKGLYGRGTIRANNKHFPAHAILYNDDCTREDYRQAVSHNHSMLAASWCDGNVANLVSNSDCTHVTTVTRMVGTEKQSFPALE